MNSCFKGCTGVGKFVNEDKWYEINISLTNGNTGDCVPLEKMGNNRFPKLAFCNELELYRHSLTHGAENLLEKPPIVQLLKNFPAFYGTRRFITVFTGPYPEPDQSNPYHPILSL
jgi:hypothetical protein